MKANVYDFDKTIFRGDSTVRFFLYCLVKQPDIIFTLIRIVPTGVSFVLGRKTKTAWKEHFYRFLHHIKDMDQCLMEFWNKNEKRIARYYLDQHQEQDVIISASPEFLLRPICEKLEIKNLIGSKVDPMTGIYDGENCWGEEKVKRLKKEMPELEIIQFYSDSLSDSPLAKCAEKAFLVKGETRIPWPEKHL